LGAGDQPKLRRERVDGVSGGQTKRRIWHEGDAPYDKKERRLMHTLTSRNGSDSA